MEDQLTTQINMTNMGGYNEVTQNVDQYDSSSDDIEMSRDSLTLTHTQTQTQTQTYQIKKEDEIGGNPKNWDWETVQKWLKQRNLGMMIEVFAEGATDKDGTDGDELLGVNLNSIMDDAGAYRAGEKLDIPDIAAAEQDWRIQSFFRELTKLQLKANEDSSADFTEKEASINDVIEMKRRIKLFIEKWDRILWIEGYVDTNSKLPTDAIISEELGVSLAIAEVYLHYYSNIERTKKKDVDELLLDFNVYNDCVLWWFVIIQILTTTQTKSIWLLFNKVAELTPGNVAIELLDRYKEDLTRFDSDRLDELAQNIVIGSQYPVCASLRMSQWFLEIASYDVARGHVFEKVSESFIDAALDYLHLVESDHMATIILEVRSDIEGMNALEMALEYELFKFVTDQRIERVTTSIMNDFEFLRPVNTDEAFQVDPLSVKLIWRKMFYSQFYFTPLGTWVVQVFLYFAYLGLFTYLSLAQFRVYDPMSIEEFIFWIFNAGYVANELQMLISYGVKQYYSETQNYFDTVISVVFIASIIIRLYALYIGAPCDGFIDESGNIVTPSPLSGDLPSGDDIANCWSTDQWNVLFVILWGTATITLWLRIINFCVLSHSLGPMVTMVFKMLGDIGTFFEIMLILFLAFAMCLAFILGDVLTDEFGGPISSGLTLFFALQGDFEFDSIDNANIAEGIVVFAYIVMIFYLIIGSIVLLNLLIAMMAKTFDTIEEDTTAAIIFARYKLALDRDTTASYIPPPLNPFAMIVLILFYIIEFIINLIRKCLYKCCCCGKGEYVPFDLAVNLMPKFMKQRKLELDEQILFENCKTYWTIQTNKGPTKCKMTKYKPEVGDHYVKFYKFEDGKPKGIKVSVQNSVDKKHQWQLDLHKLHAKGLVDFKQFDNVYVTSEYTARAHKDMKKAADDENYNSPFWICGYCRGYVEASKISVKALGYKLNVSDIEMKIIKKLSPEICPNCYRVRLERDRWELVWEIISYWMYKIFVQQFLFAMFFVVILLGLLQDPSELARAVELIKAKIISTKNEATDLAKKAASSDNDEDGKKDTHSDDPRYVGYHYSDTQLISNMNEMDDDSELFDVVVRDDVWELLADAKNDIDVFLLREKINKHVMNLSGEDELTTFEFFDDFINMDGLKKNGGDFLWNEYFQPLALTIFERIQKLRNDFVPLHLFKRYPFDITLVLDDFTGFFDEKETHKPLKDINNQDIVDALTELQSLNCINEKQRKAVINAVEFSRDEVWEWDKDDTMFTKFVRYMREVQALFQDTRTIKNMLRDVSTAIVERGAASSVFQDQIHFLFEDIRNVTLATPFFNSMRTELKKGELKVELWTIRNTLYALYFLSSAVRKNILRGHGRLAVEKQQILNTVYRLFVHDIIDPEGITDLIHTDDHDESDDDNDDNKHDDDDDDGMHEATKSFLFAQKSTVAIGAMKEDHDEDEMDEAERHQIVVERMELFHKGAITASAVRDEVSSIFDKIQQRRQSKITESAIDYYRRNGLKEVRLLQDDETLRYIFEQLSRYATFYPKHMKEQVSVDLLIKILQNTLRFGNDHKIDDETIPKMVRNERYITQLYTHLKDLYQDTIDNKFNSIIIEQTLEYMTLEDVLSMIMLYERTFDTLNTKIIEDGDTFVATHDVFCKFVDKSYDPDPSLKNQWSNKTQAASDLFQSVLDEQQNFVTLGQIRQTIDKLMNDIGAMKCGELTRIMNHLHKQFKTDNIRCKTQRAEYVQFLRMHSSNGNEFETQLTMDNDEAGATRNRGASKKKMKNPGLAFKHISKNKWTEFVDGLADNFQMNVQSTKISATLHDEEHKDLEAHKKEVEESGGGGKQIIESILDNTAFDIIKDRITEIAEDKEMEMEEEKYEQVDEKKRKKTKTTIKKKRNEVFDTALSFCAGRITLQQLFTFSKSFRSFVRNNKQLHTDLKSYDKIVNSTDDSLENAELQMRKHKIAANVEDFKNEYFGEVKQKELDNWDAEVNYLFSGCENKYDLCHKIYPFWSGSIIKDIYSFMESTEQIQGDYELKEAEFGQLKHSLNVNDELAIKLFHIIRFKIRTLTWKQIYNYFKFLLNMKYNCQRAILKSKQAEDTTVSLDGIKLLLKIQLNDESVWLFNKVDSFHGAKVTWKQIRKYLKKMISVRDEMRDFFADNARDRDFDDNKAEIINSIQENVEQSQESNEEKQEKMLEQLAMITKQLKAMQKEMKAVKNGGKLNRNKSKMAKNLGVGGPRTISFQDSKEQEEMDKIVERDAKKYGIDSNNDNNNGNTANMDISQVGDLEAAGHRYTSTPL